MFIKKFLLVVFCIIFLIGCSYAPEKKTDGIELEFWTLQLSSFDGYINNLIDEFEQQNPGIKIKWIDVPFKEGEKRSLASVMSNKVPDLINLNPSFSSTLASKKALLDFNDYLTEDQRLQYLPSAIEACSLDGFMFGLPWYITSSITIYNQNDLIKAGIKQPPKTYKELFKQSRLIKEKLNKYAFLPPITNGDYFMKVLVKDGIELTVNKKVRLNCEKAINVLEEWIRLYKDHIIPVESIVTTHSDSVGKFQSGVNTFIFIGPNFLKSIQENAPNLYKDVNVSSQVTGEIDKVDFAVMNFVVPLKSQHKPQAVKFALFLTNATNQLEFSKITPTLPSNLEALNNPFFDYTKEATLDEKARYLSAKQLKDGSISLPVLRKQQELITILNYYIQKALIGDESARTALNKANEEWNKILY